MTHIHKRVPISSADEYLAKGWIIQKREGRNVVLIWTKEGTPP